MAVLLDDRTYERVKDVVRWAEDERTTVPDDQALLEKVEPIWVLTTSGTADGSGDYPGVVSLYRAYDHTWEDLTAAVRVRGIAGGTLANATRYACRPAGQTAGGEDLYVLIHSTGGGLTLDERTGYPTCGATLETFTAATTLYIQQGLQQSGCTGLVDTGLRLQAVSTNPSLYLLPCGIAADGSVGANGGAVVMGYQDLGGTKRFSRVIIDPGPGDTDGDFDMLGISTYTTSGPFRNVGRIGIGPEPGQPYALRLHGRKTVLGGGSDSYDDGSVIALGGNGGGGGTGVIDFYMQFLGFRFAPNVRIGGGSMGYSGAVPLGGGYSGTFTSGWLTDLISSGGGTTGVF